MATTTSTTTTTTAATPTPPPPAPTAVVLAGTPPTQLHLLALNHLNRTSRLLGIYGNFVISDHLA